MRTTKNQYILRNPCENLENHENQTLPRDYHENHENHRIPRETKTNKLWKSLYFI